MTREELEAAITKVVDSVSYHGAVTDHAVSRIMRHVDAFNNGKVHGNASLRGDDEDFSASIPIDVGFYERMQRQYFGAPAERDSEMDR